ncbi:MAG: TatD family hydrolase [Chloroflexi bacterium]|nr:TatD family hydrolase [Chloroflexota bacterium]
MAELVDTHAHLDELEDLSAAVEHAKQAGVTAIISVGQDLASNIKTFKLASAYPGFIYPAIGLHPWSLGNMSPRVLEENIAFIRDNLHSAVALGEVGLDYDKRVLKGAGKDQQKDILKRLLELALEFAKPVSFHSRYAWKDSLQIVNESGVRQLVFHWYTGFSSTLSGLIAGGYYISATPAAEYHDEHRRAIREAPTERLLLETDCPVHYGREEKYRSEPADILRSLKAAAVIKSISQDEMSRIVRENTTRLFGI